MRSASPVVTFTEDDSVWVEVIALFSLGHDITLVGGLMVATFAAQADIMMPRVTEDIDALVRVSAVAREPESFVASLKERGYKLHPDHPRSDGHAFRYVREAKGERHVVDVLIDGSRTQRTTPRTEGTLIPAAIPGGAYALNMPETISIVAGTTAGDVVRPTHLGALLLKSRAAARDKTDKRERHFTDLAVLYAAMSDPGVVAEQASTKHRRELSAVAPSFDELAPASRNAAEAAYRFLSKPPSA